MRWWISFTMSSKSAPAAPRGDFAIERLHDGEQIAVERDIGAGGGFDHAHRYSPKALDCARLVGVDLDEVLCARHRQHGLDAFLHA